jgi:hypothetical protein
LNLLSTAAGRNEMLRIPAKKIRFTEN